MFGQFDHELRRAPNSKLAYGEAKIMYQNNDTEQWLASLGGKEDALEKARGEARRAVKEDRQRGREIEQEKRQQLLKKKEDWEKKTESQRGLQRSNARGLKSTRWTLED